MMCYVENCRRLFRGDDHSSAGGQWTRWSLCFHCQVEFASRLSISGFPISHLPRAFSACDQGGQALDTVQGLLGRTGA